MKHPIIIGADYKIYNIMSCFFTITYTKPKEVLVEKLSEAVLSSGGKFTGDVTNGAFEGNTPIGAFKGSYTVLGDIISVEIDKKPFLLSCGRIESEINTYLGTAD